MYVEVILQFVLSFRVFVMRLFHSNGQKGGLCWLYLARNVENFRWRQQMFLMYRITCVVRDGALNSFTLDSPFVLIIYFTSSNVNNSTCRMKEQSGTAKCRYLDRRDDFYYKILSVCIQM